MTIDTTKYIELVQLKQKPIGKLIYNGKIKINRNNYHQYIAENGKIYNQETTSKRWFLLHLDFKKMEKDLS